MAARGPGVQNSSRYFLSLSNRSSLKSVSFTLNLGKPLKNIGTENAQGCGYHRWKSQRIQEWAVVRWMCVCCFGTSSSYSSACAPLCSIFPYSDFFVSSSPAPCSHILILCRLHRRPVSTIATLDTTWTTKSLHKVRQSRRVGVSWNWRAEILMVVSQNNSWWWGAQGGVQSVCSFFLCFFASPFRPASFSLVPFSDFLTRYCRSSATSIANWCLLRPSV